ncbi:hypothetical protein AUJ59_04310 [Candidatus Beckwithbacteria bacterium CG1_02_47_37]|uniref:Uncharacterized protein n=2 Tax=Candidatus Beckwithiibacteriota TaxID=1752726 RepID=A0A1J4RQN2_9BACT|nr:MAG: hypothetical protein AUJ59_04310 [Candidatus Beckwithbacteria bacterium CG1_02_47_37]PJC66372.1 MAG: hypothetical protein CO018_02315 [Candidatus Beckwithbacteria bacterium CG_4_9_14_0_2_um_filter_47_11]
MWQGVIIEESLKDKSLLSLVEIIKSTKSTLESESDKGIFHFHSYQLPDEKFAEFTQAAKKTTKPGFYLHLVQADTLVVVLSGQIFTAYRGNMTQFKAIRDYAIKMGIHSDQLPLEHLLDHPLD